LLFRYLLIHDVTDGKFKVGVAGISNVVFAAIKMKTKVLGSFVGLLKRSVGNLRHGVSDAARFGPRNGR